MKKTYIVLLFVLTQCLTANNAFEEEKLCDNGNASACFSLGQTYAEGTNVKKDLEKAVKLYGIACSNGNDGGCFNLAVAYRHGQGVEKDYTKSVELYKKSCDMGALDGCTNLAFMYDEGLGVDKDNSKSIFYSKKACDGGITNACYNLSLQYLHKKEFTKAKEVSIKACEKEHAGACFNIGLMYSKGDGVKKDNNKAYKYFSKACDRGSNEACKYAKSNFKMHVSTPGIKMHQEKGLGYEFRENLQEAKELLAGKEINEALKILNGITDTIESDYIQDDSIFVSVRTEKEFLDYIKKFENRDAIWIDFVYRDAYFAKAFIAVEQKQYTKAMRILKRLTLISPNDATVYIEQGLIYNTTGRANKGLIAYNNAYSIAKNKKQPHKRAVALRGIGFSYIELKNFKEAEKAYLRSLLIEPSNKITKDELAYIKSLKVK